MKYGLYKVRFVVCFNNLKISGGENVVDHTVVVINYQGVVLVAYSSSELIWTASPNFSAYEE